MLKKLGLDFDLSANITDLLKYGGAAAAGAIAALLITHIDDIYDFIKKKEKEGLSKDEIKEELTSMIKEIVGGEKKESGEGE